MGSIGQVVNDISHGLKDVSGNETKSHDSTQQVTRSREKLLFSRALGQISFVQEICMRLNDVCWIEWGHISGGYCLRTLASR